MLGYGAVLSASFLFSAYQKIKVMSFFAQQLPLALLGLECTMCSRQNIINTA
jgi:hypothetical protein